MAGNRDVYYCTTILCTYTQYSASLGSAMYITELLLMVARVMVVGQD